MCFASFRFGVLFCLCPSLEVYGKTFRAEVFVISNVYLKSNFIMLFYIWSSIYISGHLYWYRTSSAELKTSSLVRVQMKHESSGIVFKLVVSSHGPGFTYYVGESWQVVFHFAT